MDLDITTAEFLRLLGRGGAYQYWWQGKGSRSTWFQAGKLKPLPSTRDIYFGVHPATIIPEKNTKGQAAQPHAVRAQLDSIAAINCLFAEFDAKDFDGDKEQAFAHIEQLEPTPSVCIDSGGGYHCYWLLEEPWILEDDQGREAALQLQYAWVARVGGDSQAKDLCRVLRIPGTQNGKYKPSRPVSILWAELDERYELTELSKLCAEAVAVAAPPIVEQPAKPAARPEQGDELRRWGQKQLAGSVERVKNAPDGQKHEALRNAARWLGGVVAAGGLSEQEAEQSLYNAIADRAKDKRGAMDTIRDGLAHGMQSPLEPPSARPAAQKQPSRPAGPELTQSEQIIELLQKWGYTFQLNLCGDIVEVNGEPLNDIIAARIRNKVRDHGRFPVRAVEDAYVTAAADNAYHPIKDYLNSLEWDGQDHIGALCSYIKSSDAIVSYANGSRRRLHEIYIQRWLIGAVAKVIAGEQNVMLVLAGGQGVGKSALARWLASGLPRYFVEGPINPEDKDCDVRAMTKFIWEVAELDATTRRSDVSALKSFITKSEVTVRKAYGRHDTTKQSTVSFIGTVNDSSTGFLADETGSRRFLVTRLTAIDWGYTKLDVNQIWAQAVALFHQGESWRLLPEESAAQRATNRDYETKSLLDEWICQWFDLDAGDDCYLSAAEIVEHLALKSIHLTGSPRAVSMELSQALARLGVQRKRHNNIRVYSNIAVREKAANLLLEVGGEVGGEFDASESESANLPTKANQLPEIEKTEKKFMEKVGKVGKVGRLADSGEFGSEEQQSFETPAADAQLIRCDAAGQPDAEGGEFWKVEDAGQIVFGPSRFYALARDHQRRLLGEETKWSQG